MIWTVEHGDVYSVHCRMVVLCPMLHRQHAAERARARSVRGSVRRIRLTGWLFVVGTRAIYTHTTMLAMSWAMSYERLEGMGGGDRVSFVLTDKEGPTLPASAHAHLGHLAARDVHVATTILQSTLKSICPSGGTVSRYKTGLRLETYR